MTLLGAAGAPVHYVLTHNHEICEINPALGNASFSLLVMEAVQDDLLIGVQTLPTPQIKYCSKKVNRTMEG